MARRIILNGTVANDGTGDTLRVAADKINDNFQEIYDYFGGGTSIALQPATRANLGGVIIGASLNVASNGLLSANIATDTGLGVVKVGSTLIISANGQIDADIPDSLLDLGITDGTTGQFLRTDGNGSFSFATVVGSGVGNPFDQDLNTTNTVAFVTTTSEQFLLSGAGTPTVESDTTLNLSANTRVEVTHSPFKIKSYTSTERNALSAQNGDMIYNSTTNKFQGYAANTWVDLH